jgi:hypothetical protein
MSNDMHIIEHTYVSLLADVSRLTGFREIRGSWEGMHWCLNEAPKLEKRVLEAIETGSNLDLEAFPSWSKRLVAESLVDPVKLRYLRQLLLFCYKADVTPSDEIVNKSYQGFLDTNHTVGLFSNWLSNASPRLLNQVRRNCQSVLYKFKPKALKPQHGPGASTTSKDKWEQWYSTIEYCYPYSDFMCMYGNIQHLRQLWDCETDSHIEAKLIDVPKDTRGPRLICVHPAEAIWLQQGLRVELEQSISLERDGRGPWPRGHIHFDNQTVNGRIALLSSKSRRYATIDMKEASDRISETLVQTLFGRYYKWFGCCRAQKVKIPYLNQKQTWDINCYAPMGNATTFPVQSLVFWAICVASMQSRGFHQPGAVFVFGDDIIVPTEEAENIINDLESFGLLVNRTKSFYRGAFRESCGVDAFNGIDVTPIRWKTTTDAEQLVSMQSLSDLAMRLRIAGYEEAASTVYARLRSMLWRRRRAPLLLTNNRDHGGIAEYTPLTSLALRDAYWHRGEQQFVTPVWRLEDVVQKRNVHDWNHVLESVLSLERTKRSSIPDRTVSRRSRLVRGWIPVKLDSIMDDSEMVSIYSLCRYY